MRLALQRNTCQYSTAFTKSDDIFYIHQTGYLMKYTNNNSRRTGETSFQHALKNHIKRRGFDVFSLLDIQPIKCGFCGRRNTTWDIEYENKNRRITLTGIKYRKPGFYCFGTSGDCPGKKLNPNSVDFVKVFFGVSEEVALQKIHERSASPFYRENHNDKESYSAYQRAQFYGRPTELVRAGIAKIQNTRAKNEIGLNVRRSGFSYISEEDGHLLRSNGERFFYSYAKSIGIADELSSNGFYPNSILMYDFFIKKLDLYIEIAGLNHNGYSERLEEKANTFGAVVLKYNRRFKKNCTDFLDAVKTKLLEEK